MAEGEHDDRIAGDTIQEPRPKRAPLVLRIRPARKGLFWDLVNRAVWSYVATGWLPIPNHEMALALAKVAAMATFKRELEIEIEVTDERKLRKRNARGE